MKALVSLLLLVLLLGSTLSANAQTYSPTGFFYPLDFNDSRVRPWSETSWLAANGDLYSSQGYTDGMVHLGIDIIADVSVSVYAPCYGKIFFSENGWDNIEGTKNRAVIVQCKTSDGVKFEALMGHLSYNSTTHLSYGDFVGAGYYLGQIGPWKGGNHLHFSIALGWSKQNWNSPSNRWNEPKGIDLIHNAGGRIPIPWNKTQLNLHNQVNPKAFLDIYSPWGTTVQSSYWTSRKDMQLAARTIIPTEQQYYNDGWGQDYYSVSWPHESRWFGFLSFTSWLGNSYDWINVQTDNDALLNRINAYHPTGWQPEFYIYRERTIF